MCLPARNPQEALVAVDASLPGTPVPHTSVVRLPAEVDIATAPAVRDEMLAALSRDGEHLVVDALDVTFMDSSGVNALVRTRERAANLGGSLHVVSQSHQVRRVLQITALEEHLGLVSSLEAAYDCAAHPETIHTCTTD